MSSSGDPIDLQVLQHLRHIDNRYCADCKTPLGLLLQSNSPSFVYASLTFGVFICQKCTDVHILVLGQSISNIKRVFDVIKWTPEQLEIILKSKSNAHMNSTYERYVPEAMRILQPNSSIEERKFWVLSKYDSKLFSYPPSTSMLDNDLFLTRPLAETANGPSSASDEHRKVIEMPSAPLRLIDYFVTMGCGAVKATSTDPKPRFETLTTPEEVKFDPKILSFYPKQYTDQPLPELLSSCTFPEGLSLSSVEKTPSQFTFVLTNVSRQKFFCATLHIWELVETSEALGKLLGIPLKEAKNLKWSIVYAPKAITIISHYPFFHLFNEWLSTLYHISLSRSPLPIQRFIMNFCAEVPLPPMGQTEIAFSMPDANYRICRPPKNRLPMVDYSLRPLFACLSIDNILRAFKYLCLEMPVCVCSRNTALLTPVQEALMSFLFPFIWQGAYIPVLPDSMVEILEAPVPFLVGLHSKYLSSPGKGGRPDSVFFIDLDNNKMYLGGDPVTNDSDIETQFPKHDIDKLRQQLDVFGTVSQGWKDKRFSTGQPFPNAEHFDPMKFEAFIENRREVEITPHARSSAASNAKKVGTMINETIAPGEDYKNFQRGLQISTSKFPNNSSSLLDPANNERETMGDAAASDKALDDKFDASEIRSAFLRFFVSILENYQDYFYADTSGEAGGTQHTSNGNGSPADNTIGDADSSSSNRIIESARSNILAPAASGGGKLVDSLSHMLGGGKTNFASLKNRYITKAKANVAPIRSVGLEDGEFDVERFVAETDDPFVQALARTQMFTNYMFEKKENKNNTEIIFFDECIIAKRNRKIGSAFRKTFLPFLSDRSDDITKSYFVYDVLDDGLEEGKVYSYERFPSCAPSGSSYGLPRKVKVFDTIPENKRFYANSATETAMKLLSIAIDDGSQRKAKRDSTVVSAQELVTSLLMESKAKNMHITEAISTIQKRFRARLSKRPKKLSLKPTDISLDMRLKIVVIQRHLRGFAARRKYSRAREQFVVVQSLWRMRHERERYRLTKKSISTILALLKGCATRRSVFSMRRVRFDERVRQILSLWALEATSMYYRSEYWSRVCGGHVSFFRLRLLGEELARLYGSIGASVVVFGSKDFSRRFEAAKKDVALVVHGGYKGGRENKEAVADLLCERHDIYKSLRADMSASDKDSLYSSFGLSNPKKRKQTLVDSLWQVDTVEAARGSAITLARIVFGSATLRNSKAYVIARARVDALVHCRLALSVGEVAGALLWTGRKRKSIN